MTIEEFNNTQFKQGDKAEYKDKQYDIISIDFEECLIAFEYIENSETLYWARCENIKYIPANPTF